MQEQMLALTSDRIKEVKFARRSSKLWWGNYNAVCERYHVARVQALRSGGTLRFRRFRGEGHFTCQIQRGASPADLFAGRCPLVNMDPVADHAFSHPTGSIRRHAQHTLLRMTIYTRADRTRRVLTFPMRYHRPLPENCRVQQVVVAKRRIATHWRYSVAFVCRIPDGAGADAPVAKRAACGINLGFRLTPLGLRIATIATESDCEYWHLPEKWMHEMDEVDRLQQRRSHALLNICEAMRAVLSQCPADLPPELRDDLTALAAAKTPSAGKLAGLILQWRRCAECWPSMLAQLEEWRRYDKVNFEIEENKRDHLMMERHERYRLLARRLVEKFTTIRIGAISLREVAMVERGDGTNTNLHHTARRNRFRAALSVLKREIEHQADQFGTTVFYVKGSFTVTCHQCGGRCAVAQDLIHTCEHCEAVFDQDQNAARNTLAAELLAAPQ